MSKPTKYIVRRQRSRRYIMCQTCYGKGYDPDVVLVDRCPTCQGLGKVETKQ